MTIPVTADPVGPTSGSAYVARGGVPSLADTSEELWDRVISTDLKGTFLMSRRFAPALVATRGSITNLSSGAGFRAGGGGVAYTAAKHGIVGISRVTALELGPDVRVNTVYPGPTDTEMVRNMAGTEELAAPEGPPMRRYGTAEEVAGVVLFLASDEASFVTGSAYGVDGGWLG